MTSFFDMSGVYQIFCLFLYFCIVYTISLIDFLGVYGFISYIFVYICRVPLKVEQANSARDTLAKAVYSRLCIFHDICIDMCL